MSEQTNSYWQNKVRVAGGTLKRFNEIYDEMNSERGRFVTASQLFPNGEKEVGGEMIYEFVIYYKEDPNQYKELDHTTGTVKSVDKMMKTISTEQGRKLDADFKTTKLEV